MKEIGIATCFLILMMIVVGSVLVIPFIFWAARYIRELAKFFIDLIDSQF